MIAKHVPYARICSGKYYLSFHADQAMSERGISLDQVEEALQNRVMRRITSREIHPGQRMRIFEHIGANGVTVSIDEDTGRITSVYHAGMNAAEDEALKLRVKASHPAEPDDPVDVRSPLTQRIELPPHVLEMIVRPEPVKPVAVPEPAPLPLVPAPPVRRPTAPTGPPTSIVGDDLTLYLVYWQRRYQEMGLM